MNGEDAFAGGISGECVCDLSQYQRPVTKMSQVKMKADEPYRVSGAENTSATRGTDPLCHNDSPVLSCNGVAHLFQKVTLSVQMERT